MMENTKEIIQSHRVRLLGQNGRKQIENIASPLDLITVEKKSAGVNTIVTHCRLRIIGICGGCMLSELNKELQALKNYRH